MFGQRQRGGDFLGCGSCRPVLLGDLVLQNFEFPHIRLEQGGYFRTCNMLRRENFFKIIVQGQEQFDGIGMGIGAFGLNVVPDLVESLQVNLGDFIAFKLFKVLQMIDFVSEVLQDLIRDFPVQRKDDGFKLG